VKRGKRGKCSDRRRGALHDSAIGRFAYAALARMMHLSLDFSVCRGD
jgi:hypothetical protein